VRLAFIIYLLLPVMAFAQFDPAGGKDGSNAVHRDNASLSYWGDSVEIIQGNQRINASSPVKVTTGEAIDALNAPDNRTVSLGDGGQATYYFERAISNISGPDFVVFENGFEWVGGYFLELAFVEVSSDGKRYVRFPAQSIADTATQIENLAYMECEWYHNLAGKHQAPFGTPFDLNELTDSAGIDINAITHVRLIDVVGSLSDSFAGRDVNGIKINDPWPTDFESGGFDLDAIGVLQFPLGDNKLGVIKRFVAPNPTTTFNGFSVNLSYRKLNVISLDGSLLYQSLEYKMKHKPNLSPGIYIVRIETDNGIFSQRICVTQ
jgi:hypothetical protein